MLKKEEAVKISEPKVHQVPVPGTKLQVAASRPEEEPPKLTEQIVLIKSSRTPLTPHQDVHTHGLISAGNAEKDIPPKIKKTPSSKSAILTPFNIDSRLVE